MRYHDPKRPTFVNGRPCWLGTQIALPELNIYPRHDGLWEVRIMIGKPEGSYWAQRYLTADQLVPFMLCWEQDPESTRERVFKEPLNV